MASVLLHGQRYHTNGPLPGLGTPAPPAVLVDRDLRDVRLSDFAGSTLLINAVPSLDTPVCALSTRKLSELSRRAPGARVLVVSADLPFAQGRFLLAERLEQVTALSMMRDRSFAEHYGLLLVDGPLAGLCARALLVVDPAGVLAHAELVGDLAAEPDYHGALEAAEKMGSDQQI